MKATAVKATAMKATVDEAIVQTLLARGVDVVFGMPGSHINAFYATLSKTQIRLVTVKHEGNGAVMADVYGRLTGKPGVLITTAGPGSTNALSGIAQAYNALSPVVHIAGGVHRGAANEGFHGCTSEDFLLKVFQPVTKWSSRITQPELVPRILNEAFDVAVSGKPGPVHVQIPWDLHRIGQVEMEPTPPQGEQRRGVRNRSILASMMEIHRFSVVPGYLCRQGGLGSGGPGMSAQVCRSDGHAGHHSPDNLWHLSYGPSPVCWVLFEFRDTASRQREAEQSRCCPCDRTY